MLPARCFASLLALGAGLSALSAEAQTIGDDIKKHADQGLEKKKKKPPPPNGGRRDGWKRPPPAHHKTQFRKGQGRPAAAPAPAAAPPPAAPPAPPEEELPIRVIGKHLKLDPQIGAQYRGWYPQQYPRVEVDGRGYFTWSISLRAKILRWVSLEKGHYESNALASPTTSEASVAVQGASYIPKAAWLMGQIGFDFDWLIKPMVRYETRAHDTTARVKAGQQVRIVPPDALDGPPDRFLPTDSALRMTSSFQTFVLAAEYNPGAAGMVGMPSEGIPPFYVGVGLIEFHKPYQFVVGDVTLDEYLFNARFRGVGLAYGLSTPEIPLRFYVDFLGITGLGEVKLFEDLTLNETVADDTFIGFTQANVTFGYLYPITRGAPTLLIGASLQAGGAGFFFFKTKYEADEEIQTPPLNWDFLYGGQIYLTLPL